jgi:hypothetical protein
MYAVFELKNLTLNVFYWFHLLNIRLYSSFYHASQPTFLLGFFHIVPYIFSSFLPCSFLSIEAIYTCYDDNDDYDDVGKESEDTYRKKVINFKYTLMFVFAS